jgi:fatty acid desaturase
MSDRPKQLMKKYEVKLPGVSLEELRGPADDLFEWEQTPFYDTLKARVREHFREKISSSGEVSPSQWMGSYKCKLSRWVETLFYLSCAAFSAYHWYQGSWWSLLAFPIFHWLSCGYLLHHGGHQSLSTIEVVNNIACYLGSIITSPTSWHASHNFGHHLYTNINGLDPDLTHFQNLPVVQQQENSTNNNTLDVGYRLHKDQPYYRPYRNYLRTIVLSSIFNMIGMLGVDINSIENIRLSRGKYWRHIAARFIVFSVLVISPFLRFPIMKAVAFATVPYALIGVIFYFVTQVSHLNESCFHPQKLKVGEAKREWAVHQVITASDYAIHSQLWFTLSVGLNLQVIHHLFPSVDASHYADLIPIVQKTCEEYKVPYTVFPSYAAILGKYIDYVASLNKDDNHASKKPHCE